MFYTKENYMETLSSMVFIPASEKNILYSPERSCKFEYPMLSERSDSLMLIIREKKISDLSDRNGGWGVYKFGGFSGNIGDINIHKEYQYHRINFNTEEIANEYCAVVNEMMINLNWGGGIHHVKKDDRTSIPLR